LQQSLSGGCHRSYKTILAAYTLRRTRGETQYFARWIEIGDPVNNTLSARFNVDATRAAEVQTGRIGAGYAHSGANVFKLGNA